MTEADLEPGETSPAAVPASSNRTRNRWVVVAVVVAVLALGGVAAAVIADREDSPSYGNAQIGWMHQGCEQWADSPQRAGGPDEGWCRSMADWMDGRIGSRPGGMMLGPMMWQDPDSMRATCREWMVDDPAAGGSRRAEWCDEMVGWLSDHMGDWDRWMRDGPMGGS